MGGAARAGRSLRARDVAEYVEALAPPDSGVPRDENGFTFGDPETAVRGIAVTWMPTAEALREAAGRGLNLLVVSSRRWLWLERRDEGSGSRPGRGAEGQDGGGSRRWSSAGPA